MQSIWALPLVGEADILESDPLGLARWQEAMIFLVDGQIFLDTDLFYSGVRPAMGEETGAGGSRRGGGTSGENAPEGEAGEKAKDSAASQGQQAKGEEARGGENKKRSLVEAEDELKERAQSKKFDWWLLIKVLIVLFIIALIFLILIGNTRRSG
ncbi:hypothetical protein EBR78_01025 [bacterium]|nr:hypothetical protein [bacterium]